ncbi:hypothetical protein M1L60_15800 [Actinoplanes sp. TRM 88003]|uniref:Uncharacterized protein n=1 Tax=Paractinoplanes aksuensis TaxID=2939490 RepID=A0ABT1DMK0_9ACTN|nr:hypothetical protein [Actinoplanes aksuensis]MCO8272058.1 hypothetical protein [Actinoplanes aksuensis]
MEPVPVTRTVRRTVRMAVALVVGQAVLCALIGWLTLGQSRSEPARSPGAAVDQLAAPPPADPATPSARTVIAPTTQAREPVPATSRPAPRKKKRSPAAPERPATTTAPTTRAPQPISVPPDPPALVPPAPPPSPPPSPSPSSALPSSPSPSAGLVRDPVRVGDECRPTGAYGRTAEGVLVRCVREWRHPPRWKIV